MRKRKMIIAAALAVLLLSGCRSDTIYVQIGTGGENPPATTTQSVLPPATTTQSVLPPATTEIPGQTVEPQGDMVWIPTNGGTKYHKDSACSSMQEPKQVTKEEAENQGFTPCKRCYK